MRTTFKIALASVLVFTLAAAAPELNAQARRSTTTTSNSRSSDNKSATTASRSAASSSSAASRSTATATRSAGTTANRQSTSTSAAARQGSTATRNTAAPSGSTSTQVNRRSNNTGTTTTGSQVNRNTGSNGNTGNTGTTATRRSNANTTSGSTAARRDNGTTRSAGNAAATTPETPSRRVTTSRSANTGAAEAPATQNTTPVRTVRSNANATSSNGLTSAPEARANVSRGGAATNNRGAVPNVNYSTGHDDRGGIRMDEGRNLNRIPPRERDFIVHDRPGAFFGHDPHFFGYRVQTLPPRYRRISHWGRAYYFYNNVYYLRYGNWYVITRPPFGVMIDIALRDMAFASVRFSYYHNVYRTFDIIDSNYRTILEQNREIARNNALLARQNSALALNSNRALSAYEIASALGLVQSFANINTEYFYEDGVFYVATKKNRYEVIVPPAGALVNELPDDYDTIVLNGVEYYKVDDTVYRLVLVDGIPALEVLGQMYGNMARKYNYYY